MADRTFKLIAFSAQSVFYLDVLASLRERAYWTFRSEQQELIVPFVITCAAALECVLNDCLIQACRGTKHREAQLDGYLSMTLKGKLINVVPTVTDQRFAINQDHKVYQHLVDLIRIRNKLVHNRSSFFQEHIGTVTTTEDGQPLIKLPEGVDIEAPANHDWTFGIPGDVGRFHDAVATLYESLDECEGDDFKGNDLIVAAEKRPDVPRFRIKDDN